VEAFMDNKKSNIAAKMHDYRRFAIILLCVGSFFYLGTILPAEGKTEYSTAGYLLASVVFLAVSIACFMQATKYKKNLVEKDE
jgi:uncharacterized membrane protein YiaA